MKNILIIIIAVGLFLAACDNKHGNLSPIIEILSPTEGQMFDNGETVRMQVNITHEDDLHNVELKLIHLGPDTVLWEHSVHSHSRSLMIDKEWIALAPHHTDIRLTVKAHDHNDNKSEKSVDIHIHD